MTDQELWHEKLMHALYMGRLLFLEYAYQRNTMTGYGTGRIMRKSNVSIEWPLQMAYGQGEGWRGEGASVV